MSNEDTEQSNFGKFKYHGEFQSGSRDESKRYLNSVGDIGHGVVLDVNHNEYHEGVQGGYVIGPNKCLDAWIVYCVGVWC